MNENVTNSGCERCKSDIADIVNIINEEFKVCLDLVLNLCSSSLTADSVLNFLCLMLSSV
jgi:hypothetical protein